MSNNLIAAINSNRHILAALQGVKKKKKRKKYNYVGSENHPPTLIKGNEPPWYRVPLSSSTTEI